MSKHQNKSESKLIFTESYFKAGAQLWAFAIIIFVAAFIIGFIQMLLNKIQSNSLENIEFAIVPLSGVFLLLAIFKRGWKWKICFFTLFISTAYIFDHLKNIT